MVTIGLVYKYSYNNAFHFAETFNCLSTPKNHYKVSLKSQVTRISVH